MPRFSGAIALPQQAAPAIQTDRVVFYAKTDGLYYKKPDGVEIGPLVGTPANMVTTDTAQTIAGAKTFSTDVSVSVAGSSTTTPRLIGLTGLTTGTAARLQFGDALNSLQNSHNGRTILQGYHGIEIVGGRASTTARGFIAGSGAADPSLMVRGEGAAGQAVFVARQEVTNATGDLAQFYVQGNLRAKVAAAGDIHDASGRVYSPGNLPPAPSNMVTIDTVQTITAIKTLRSNVSLQQAAPTGSTTVSSPSLRLVAYDNDGAGTITERPATLYADLSGAPGSGVARLNLNANITNTVGDLQEAGNRVYSPGNKVPVAGLSATGTASSATYLRGDNTWAAAPVPVEPYVMSVTGTLTVQTGKSRIYFEEAVTVLSVRASVNTAPAGASVIVDVNKNGTTLFTTQTARPTIAALGFTATGTPAVTTFAAGDYMTVDVDQIGSTTAGADLTVVIRVRRT